MYKGLSKYNGGLRQLKGALHPRLVLQGGWVYEDNFEKSFLTVLNVGTSVMIKNHKADVNKLKSKYHWILVVFPHNNPRFLSDLSEQSHFTVYLTGLVWRRQQECHFIYHCHSGV